MVTLMRGLILMLFIFIFFSSCTIEQRHYRSGFYISWDHNKQVAAENSTPIQQVHDQFEAKCLDTIIYSHEEHPNTIVSFDHESQSLKSDNADVDHRQVTEITYTEKSSYTIANETEDKQTKTPEWAWPFLASLACIAGIILLLNGMYILSILVTALAAFLIIFGFYKIFKRISDNKKQNIVQTVGKELLIGVALLFNVLSILLVIVLAWSLAAQYLL